MSTELETAAIAIVHLPIDDNDKSALEKLQSELLIMKQEVEKVTQIKDSDTAKHALSLALQSRKLRNRIEESRKELVRPHIDFQKAIKKVCDDLSEKFDSMELYLQGKIESWLDEENENPFCKINKLEVEDGSMSLKENWDFQIVNEAEIPAEFLTVDMTAIKIAIKNGRRNIPGVKIVKSTYSEMRVKG